MDIRETETGTGIMGKKRFTIEEAIDYIGSHRKTGTKPHLKSCPLAMTMAKQLVKSHLAMWNGDRIMLTYNGERVFTRLHPHSKYRIM